MVYTCEWITKEKKNTCAGKHRGRNYCVRKSKSICVNHSSVIEICYQNDRPKTYGERRKRGGWKKTRDDWMRESPANKLFRVVSAYKCLPIKGERSTM